MKYPMRISLRPGTPMRGGLPCFDYFVNDHRLGDLIDVHNFVSPFGWVNPEYQQRFARMLLRKEESDLRPGRYPLFVCSECADYGCGVTTCAISREDNMIVWSDFGFENDYENNRDALDIPREYAVFKFDPTQYYETFKLYSR